MKTVSTPSQLQPSTIRDKLWPPKQQLLQLQVCIIISCMGVNRYAIVDPGAPPGNARSTMSTATTITLMWDELNCVDRNGVITGYVVQYGITAFNTSMNVTGTSASDRTFTASGLVPLTTYMFRIAAANSDGVGPYSSVESLATTFPTGIDFEPVSCLSQFICRC